jgi:hypothetical protein
VVFIETEERPPVPFKAFVVNGDQSGKVEMDVPLFPETIIEKRPDA